MSVSAALKFTESVSSSCFLAPAERERVAVVHQDFLGCSFNSSERKECLRAEYGGLSLRALVTVSLRMESHVSERWPKKKLEQIKGVFGCF